MNGLKKAAIQYSDNAEKVAGCGYEFQTEELTEAFIAGAQWQKQKDMQDESDLAVIAAMDGAERGKKIMREQMMKDAISVKVDNLDSLCYNYCIQHLNLSGKDFVKVIILKNE